MSNETEITRIEDNNYAPPTGGAFSGNMQSFSDAQRIAGALSASTLVPKDYQSNTANCMIAMEMAQRVNANPMAVMQNLYIIHGKPSWSSQFIIAMINGCGRFSPLRFEMMGGPADEDKWGCRAYATDIDSNEKLEGPWVSIKMAKAEGWYSKAGSKWKTMPDLMLRYRAAAFFGRLYAPDLLMGMSSDDEIVDIRANKSSRHHVEPESMGGFSPAQESAPIEKDVTPQPTEQQPEAFEGFE